MTCYYGTQQMELMAVRVEPALCMHTNCQGCSFSCHFLKTWERLESIMRKWRWELDGKTKADSLDLILACNQSKKE